MQEERTTTNWKVKFNQYSIGKKTHISKISNSKGSTWAPIGKLWRKCIINKNLDEII